MTANPQALSPAADVAPVGDRGHWRRRIAYALLISYALVMFIPFAWSVITTFKTLPDSVRLRDFRDQTVVIAFFYRARSRG